MAAVNLIGSYNYALVALSVLIAMFASYAALYLAGRVTAAGGWTRIVWLLGGAGAMGTGIWSMHYIGMLAFILPVPVAYHWPTVLLSLFAAILASVVALGVVSRQKMGPFRALAGSVLMGAGIAGMHYIGMAAMRLRAVCQFNPFLVVLSVVFAILISLAALWITFHFRDEKTGIGWQKLAGAVVMGAAIPIMHYTGMAAASFTASDMPVDLTHAISISTLGTAGIAAVTFIVLGLALLTSWVDRRLATQTLEVQGEKLQQSETYLAEAQRLSHTGSFGWRLSTGAITWSEETFRIFQYDRSTKPTVELVLQRVHSEDAASVKETIACASRDGKNFEHEYRLVMPDGTVKYVHVVAHAERDESGEIEFIGAVMDVSDRKRAEEELRRSEAAAEQRLRLVVDTTPAMINTCRPDGYLDYVNKGWLDYFGFSLETALDRADVMKMPVPSADISGREWQPIIHPEDLVRFRDNWKATLASGKPGECEGRVRRFDGEYRWHLFRGVPLCDETGTPVKWYVSAFDIEDRKRAEVLLSGENRLLEMIARGDSRALILDAICRLVEGLAAGSMSSILLADPSANRLRHGAAPSLPSSYNEAVDGLLIGPSAGSCGTAAYRAEPVIVSDIATDPLWVDYRDLALAHGLRSCWSTPILSSVGKVLGTFAMYYREPRSPTALDRSVIRQIVDLANIAVERKQAEEALDALRQAQADLARVNRLTTMGELTASLAHEVNQPIAAAVTSANSCFHWLAGDLPNLDKARAAAMRIVKDGTRAAEIISRIRLLFQKGTPQWQLVDVNEIVGEMIMLLHGEATRYSISVRTELAGDLPQVMGDRVQLQQVLMNLMTNSIDAMKAVDGTRDLAINSQRAENEQLLVSVCDTGVGLPSQQADQVFDAFFTTKPNGTGMGLRICRSIVESHGGRLWAANNSPRGAKFLFTLPTKLGAPE
jgi:NO-binding membrane sensor protein with MHYT domain/signal transduction histidine kinase